MIEVMNRWAKMRIVQSKDFILDSVSVGECPYDVNSVGFLSYTCGNSL